MMNKNRNSSDGNFFHFSQCIFNDLLHSRFDFPVRSTNQCSYQFFRFVKHVLEISMQRFVVVYINQALFIRSMRRIHKVHINAYRIYVIQARLMRALLTFPQIDDLFDSKEWNLIAFGSAYSIHSTIPVFRFNIQHWNLTKLTLSMKMISLKKKLL